MQSLESIENFKIKAGYSKNEVERKKEALDRVLVPLSLNELIDMLKEVGFKHVEPIIRWNTFVSIVAQRLGRYQHGIPIHSRVHRLLRHVQRAAPCRGNSVRA